MHFYSFLNKQTKRKYLLTYTQLLCHNLFVFLIITFYNKHFQLSEPDFWMVLQRAHATENIWFRWGTNMEDGAAGLVPGGVHVEAHTVSVPCSLPRGTMGVPAWGRSVWAHKQEVSSSVPASRWRTPAVHPQNRASPNSQRGTTSGTDLSWYRMTARWAIRDTGTIPRIPAAAHSTAPAVFMAFWWQWRPSWPGRQLTSCVLETANRNPHSPTTSIRHMRIRPSLMSSGRPRMPP